EIGHRAPHEHLEAVSDALVDVAEPRVGEQDLDPQQVRPRLRGLRREDDRCTVHAYLGSTAARTITRTPRTHPTPDAESTKSRPSVSAAASTSSCTAARITGRLGTLHWSRV